MAGVDQDVLVIDSQPYQLVNGPGGSSPHREMAEKYTILRATVGSTAHGLHLEGTDDRDEMGVCIESLEAFGGFSEFEQYIYRSAADREGRQDAPSQPGDLDLTIYSLRKFLRLAMQGNPTILNLLFVPQLECIQCDARGAQLQELAPWIVSRQAGKRYLGYMESQRMRLLGERGQKKVNRPALEAKYGYDTKYAMHLLRLGYQGIELLSKGRISMPLDNDNGWRDYIHGVRVGKQSLQDVLTVAGNFERELKDLLMTSPLPEKPDTARVEEWMLNMYLENWKAQSVTTSYVGTRKAIDVVEGR